MRSGPVRHWMRTSKMPVQSKRLSTSLAALEGTICGQCTFTGAKATVVAKNDPYGLQSSATFTGSFDGGFYGSGASEAGGTLRLRHYR